jgi:uncharacterized membrane protein YesL
MKLTSLRPLKRFFLVASLLGFLLINLPFLYYFSFEKSIYEAAMGNPVALVFIAEAFLLMFLFAFLIAKLGWTRPGWLLFIVFSILGSMAFSIPFMLYLHLRKEGVE